MVDASSWKPQQLMRWIEETDNLIDYIEVPKRLCNCHYIVEIFKGQTKLEPIGRVSQLIAISPISLDRTDLGLRRFGM